MKIVHVFVLIVIMREAHSATTQEERIRDTNQGILLRKLRSEPNDSNGSEFGTWNNVLAGVVVDSVKSLIPHKDEEEIEDASGELTEFFTTFCSNSLYYYKKYIYDKLFTSHIIEGDIIEEWTGDPEIEVADPGNDVEIVETGEMCEGCIVTDKEGECPVGAFRGEDGRCIASLLLAIPRQCPIGYRLDRLGYCRRKW